MVFMSLVCACARVCKVGNAAGRMGRRIHCERACTKTARPPGNHEPSTHTATMLSCTPQYTLGNRAKNMSGGGQDDIKNRRVMYKFHEDQTKAWLSGTLLPRLGTSGEPLLVAFSECWRAHRLFVEWMRKMFVYLDSDARREGALMPHDSLTAVGLELFKVILQAVESPPPPSTPAFYPCLLFPSLFIRTLVLLHKLLYKGTRCPAIRNRVGVLVEGARWRGAGGRICHTCQLGPVGDPCVSVL